MRRAVERRAVPQLPASRGRHPFGVGVGTLDIQPELIIRIPGQGQTAVERLRAGPAVLVRRRVVECCHRPRGLVDGGVGGRADGVADVTLVHVRVAQCQPGTQGLGERARNDAFVLHALLLELVADSANDFQLVAGVVGLHGDDAGRGVLAEVQRLGALQDGHLADVEHGLVDHPALGVVNAIDDGGHGLLDADGARRRADAADADARAAAGAGADDVELGRHLGDVLQALQIEIGHALLADDRYGHRDLAHGLFHPPGGHHDLLDLGRQHGA